MFILDINNYLPEEVELLKYADDILTYVIGDVPAHMPQAIANAIHRWCEDNMMSLNVAKCKAIVANPTSSKSTVIHPPVIIIKGQRIEIVESYKYLGFEISPQPKPRPTMGSCSSNYSTSRIHPQTTQT